VVHGPPGRGGQLNRGAEAASGTHLLFLHADTRLPPDWLQALDQAFEAPRPPAATVFRIRYEALGLGLRLIEAGMHIRCRWTGVAYGDHAFGLSRKAFERAGGFPEIPLMEDVAFCKRIRALGRLELLDSALLLSPRRQGTRPLLNAARNQALLLLFRLGVSPERLYRLYYG